MYRTGAGTMTKGGKLRPSPSEDLEENFLAPRQNPSLRFYEITSESVLINRHRIFLMPSEPCFSAVGNKELLSTFLRVVVHARGKGRISNTEFGLLQKLP